MEEPSASSPIPPPVSPKPRVLLIQTEWPARALLKAELETRGWEALGAEDVTSALRLCTLRGFRPDVVILDGTGLSESASDLGALQFLRGAAPLLLLGSGQYRSPSLDALHPSRVVVRPFTIGDVADALSALQ